MRTFVWRVTTMVRVEVADGATPDRETLGLAADVANRNGEAHAENIRATVIGRDRAEVGVGER